MDLQQKSSSSGSRRKTLRIYCSDLRRRKKRQLYGEDVGVAVASAGLVVVVVVVVVSVDGLGLAADGAVTSVFCSHAASKAALAKMQMYFFIIGVWISTVGHIMNRSKRAFRI
jgi:hypothetical protein